MKTHPSLILAIGNHREPRKDYNKKTQLLRPKCYKNQSSTTYSRQSELHGYIERRRAATQRQSRHRHRRISRNRTRHCTPSVFPRRQSCHQLLLQLGSSRFDRRRVEFRLRRPSCRLPGRYLRSGSGQIAVRRGGIDLQIGGSHPRQLRRRAGSQIPLARRHHRRRFRQDFRCQRPGRLPLLQRSRQQDKARRRGEDHLLDFVAGGVAEARIRGVHSVEGGGGGDGEDSSQGAEGDGDNGECGGAGAGGDGDVLRREDGGGDREGGGGVPARAAGGDG